MVEKLITLVGGSGFVGRYVVRELARAGYRLRVVCRCPERAAFLKTAGDLGQIAPVAGDLMQPETIAPHIRGAQGVVNLTGILAESSTQTFSGLHAKGAKAVAEICRAARVEALVHISALGVNRATQSAYARTKTAGETAARAAFPETVILRPSVVFGPEDDFFNRFARMAMLSPALPLVGGGQTLFQPVYVADIAQAVRAGLESPACIGKTYELGGPEVYTFRQLMEYTLRVIGRRRALLPLPFAVARWAACALQFAPAPFTLTPDQVRLLRYDNIVEPAALTFASLGIRATPVELIVPDYLRCYRRNGRA